jgi:hypothetical protein
VGGGDNASTETLGFALFCLFEALGDFLPLGFCDFELFPDAGELGVFWALDDPVVLSLWTDLGFSGDFARSVLDRSFLDELRFKELLRLICRSLEFFNAPVLSSVELPSI